MESRPLTRLSLPRVSVVGPSWVIDGCYQALILWYLPHLCVSLESHPLARFSLITGRRRVLPGFDSLTMTRSSWSLPHWFDSLVVGCIISPGFAPLMIWFVGVSPTDSTLPCSGPPRGAFFDWVYRASPGFDPLAIALSFWTSGVTRLWSTGKNPTFPLESHPLARLSHR